MEGKQYVDGREQMFENQTKIILYKYSSYGTRYKMCVHTVRYLVIGDN